MPFRDLLQGYSPVKSSRFDLAQALAVFGFDSLRPGQREIIQDVLCGTSVVAVMPTGAGKSLCYQLPAVVLAAEGGTAVVVSPLIALMKDQVDSLVAKGICAASLTSAASASEQQEILEGIRAGVYTLVYVAPERFRSPRFTEALEALGDRLSLFAIDEAHCISEWGHDFRPDYRRLGQAIRELRPRRLIALTATATPEVREDIAQQLDRRDAQFHVHGFDRPNLSFSVVSVRGGKDKQKRLANLVRDCVGGVALVYAATRKGAERYAAALTTQGIVAHVYHAGLDEEVRRVTQEAYMSGRLDVLVATNAFGMGVDKNDVRVVVHADLPRSLEAYYQEAGRGGRDGNSASCTLLFNHADVKLQEFLIDSSFPSPSMLRELWKLLRQDPTLGQQLEAVRTQLTSMPHVSQFSSAVRILHRHGYLHENRNGFVATQPQEIGGTFAPFDPDKLALRAQVERKKLRRMVEYAYHVRCRRQYILSYFGDGEWADRHKRCDFCDACTGASQRGPLSEAQKKHVQTMLEVVESLSGRFGRTKLAAIANGTLRDERFLSFPMYGSLEGLSSQYLMDVLRALDGAGLVETVSGEYPTVAISALGKRASKDPTILCQVTLPSEAKQSNKKSKNQESRFGVGETPDSGSLAVAARLREIRKHLADARSVPAYVIFSNRTLESIAMAKPTTPSELLQVDGIGPNRLEAYGAEILSVVRDAMAATR